MCFSIPCYNSTQMASKTMRNYYNKNTLINTNSYIKQVYIFVDSKIKNYLCIQYSP